MRNLLFELTLVLLAFFWKCYRRCRGCTIYFDDFVHDPLSALAWSTTGTVTVAGSYVTLEQGAEIVCLLEPDTTDDAVRLRVLVRVKDNELGSGSGNAENGVLRIKLARLDDDNYHFFELNLDAGTIMLGTRFAGIETTLAGPEVVDDFTAGSGEEFMDDEHLIELCWYPGSTSGQISGILFSYAGLFTGAGGDSGWTDESLAQGVEDGGHAWVILPGDATFGATRFAFDAMPVGSEITGVGFTLFDCRWRSFTGISEIFVEDIIIHFNDVDTDPIGPVEVVALGSDIGAGGAGNLLGADDLTWGDVASGLVSVTANITSVGNGFEIDAVGVEVHYTSPDRTRGVFQATYYNITGASRPQCIQTRAAYAAPGRGAAVEAVLEDWELASFLYEFAQDTGRLTCPTCDECDVFEHPHPQVCDDCCDLAEELPGELMIGDVGNPFSNTGGANGCLNCGDVGGFYLLEAQSNRCWWHYSEVIPCGEDKPDGLLTYSLYMERGEDDVCRWKMTAIYAAGGEGGSIIQDPSDPDENVTWGVHGGHIAYYESSDKEDLCDQFPVTLNKVGGSDNNAGCTGTFPDVITLDSAP